MVSGSEALVAEPRAAARKAARLATPARRSASNALVGINGHREGTIVLRRTGEQPTSLSRQTLCGGTGSPLRRLQESAKIVRKLETTTPREDQMSDNLEERFPAIASWIEHGWIEVGDQEWTRSKVVAHDCGGMVYEGKGGKTLTKCLEALERGLREHIKERWGDEFE